VGEPVSTREDFERAIASTPDDPAPYAVYADWLIAQGDPLGEVITASLRNDVRQAGVLGKAEALLKGLKLRWHWGLARSLGARNDLDTLRAAADAVRALPCGFLLDALDLTFEEQDDLEEANVALSVLAEGPPLGWVRRLTIDAEPRYSFRLDPHEHTPLALTSLAGLFPELRELDVRCHHLGDDLPALPSLRRLKLCPDVLMSSSIPDPAGTPALEELALSLGHFDSYDEHDEEAVGRAERLNRWAAQAFHVAQLAERSHPALRVLRLWHVPDGDSLVRLLAPSKLLPQLRVLDLRSGSLSDEGSLLANAARFSHLERLEISGNPLATGDLRALRAALPNLVTDGPGGEGRYSMSVE
jgi:uncharacterized protein (TIGR02996 family)